MNALNATCPPASVLSDFGLGKLDAASAETISRHLETCVDCRQLAASLSGDSFVGRLRKAGGAERPEARRERTYVPGESLANAASSTDGASAWGDLPRSSQKPDGRGRPPHGPAAPSSISAPPELANHPDYELVKELGQGGMGTVYLAKNRMMDRPEVLKVISKALLDRPGALERFQQEIRSAAKLAHPNIVAAYSVLRPGDLLVFAMEYVKGQDLSEVVKQRGPLPLANAAFYIHQVANGLQHAFEKGMVHRDIKPNNLMLAIEGKKHIVKILDFGLAKATSEKSAEGGLTKSGQMLGTPDYVAPEQTLDAHKADIRADIYSLGCTLYFLLSGGPPFQEQSLYAILEAHHKREPKPLNLVRPDVPVELAAVVGKMMAKDPARRYQTPAEVAKALVPFFKPGQTVTPASHGESPEAVTTNAAPQTPVPTAQSLPMGAPLPMAVIPLAVAAPLPAAGAQEFSVTIDTRRAAPKRRADWWRRRPPWQRWSAAGGAAALVLLGIVFLLQTKDGAIRVEINDDQIEVAIKGTDITLTKADNGQDIKISPGKKGLIVERGDFKFETDKLVLKKGETVSVAVTLLEGQIIVKQGPRVIGRGKLGPDTSKRFGFEFGDPKRASWSIEGDELVQSLFYHGEIIFGDPNWQDIDISLELKRTEGQGPACIWFGYQDHWNANGFLVGIDTKLHSVWSTIDGIDRQLVSRDGTIDTGKWHRVGLRIRGKSGKCFLDGEEILAFETERLPRGRIGLWSSSSIYRFRNITVKSPNGKLLLEGLPDLDVEPQPKPFEAEFERLLADRAGTLPTAADGRPLNLDFETGNLRDWTAEGDAFASQPVKGDTLHARYRHLRSRHAGQFWIAGHEQQRSTGTLTSAPFKVTKPYASFLMSGGMVPNTCVELVRSDSKKPFFRAMGRFDDALWPVAVDLREHRGQEIFIRVLDPNNGPSGHISFDDFRLHDSKPDFSPSFASADSAEAGTKTNVLKLLDIERDRFEGRWHWDAHGFLAGIGQRLCRLPLAIPDEYELALTIEGVPRTHEVQLNLPIGGQMVQVVLDGWGFSASGLRLVDGKDGNDNETTHKGRVLLDGQSNNVVCQVRANSLKVVCNGATVIDWRGDPTRLSVARGIKAVAAGYDGILVGGPWGNYRISRIELTPLAPRAASGEQTAADSARATENDWVPLFNGKDRTGWKTHPSRQGLWRVENGILIGSGPAASYLFSERGDFTNFHVRVEARINDGGNSGVFGRSNFTAATVPEGYEAQINSTVDGPKTGSIYGPAGGRTKCVREITNSIVPPNEWFTLELIAQDNHLTVKVNGQTTADWSDPDRRFPMGHIALQQHDPQTVVEFRKIEVKEPQTAADAKPPGVPDDAQAFGGHWYKFYADQLSWKAARERCQSLGGHLVIIDSLDENAFVGGIVEKAGRQDAWIGATDEADEGKWRDVDGKLLSFTNWSPIGNQPNNKNKEEHYAVMSNRTIAGSPSNWRWSDQPNESKELQPGFVCEWEANAAASNAPMSKPSASDFAVEVMPIADKTVYPGEPDLLAVRVARRGYDGPLHVALQGLPRGFQAASATIPAGQSRVLVGLDVPQNAGLATTDARVVASFDNRSVEQSFKLMVRERPPVQPFEVPLNGLGGQASMKPISFGPDWLGRNKPLSPQAWETPGACARTETTAALTYPTIPVSRYVFEAELQILQPEKKLLLCLGDPWVAVHLEFYWDKSRSKVGMKLMEWRYGGWGWTGGHLVDVGERLPLKWIFLDGRQVLCLRNKPILSVGSPWPADLSLRIWSETPGSALIHRCSCRELREEDVELIDSAMPEAELRLDVVAAKARIEALRKGLALRPENGKPFAAGQIGSPMAWIPPGEYWRGCPDRKPPQRHRVKITQGFWMGRLEVTQEDFKALMHANPSRIKGSPYLPVDWVTWQDAMAFCDELNQMEGKARRLPKGYQYRLPTDAEWEYACRAGSEQEFSVPVTEVLWPEQSSRYPHQVGEKSANAWGLYDMHGNAMEWCMDGWHEYPKDTSTVLADPYHPGNVNHGTFVVRGGAWWLPAWAAKDACRSCWREQNHSSPAGAYRGFRVVLAPALEPAAKRVDVKANP